jgi:hypothetical protein
MKFKHTGTYHSGHSIVGTTLEKISPYENLKLKYDKRCRFEMEEAFELDTDQGDKLKASWFVIVFYKNTEAFQYETAERFNITEINTEPTDEELREFIRLTYNLFQETFDKRRQEFTILNVLGDIHPDTIEQLVPQLREVLLAQLK